MDFIIEVFGELIVEAILEVCFDTKIKRWIRYSLIVLVAVVFCFIVLGLAALSIAIFSDSLWLSLLLMGLSIFIFYKGVCKLNSVFKKKGTH